MSKLAFFLTLLHLLLKGNYYKLSPALVGVLHQQA